MSGDRSKNALTVAWEHSESNATDGDLHAAWAAAWAAARDAAGDAAWAAAWAAQRQKLIEVLNTGVCTL